MARKVGQIIARGDRRWLIRVYFGRDHENAGMARRRVMVNALLEASVQGGAFTCAADCNAVVPWNGQVPRDGVSVNPLTPTGWAKHGRS